jgi:preprotein translocase SecE subunit
MARVTWPSRTEVYATTIVVILTSIFFGLYLWSVDLFLDRLIRWVYAAAGVA